GIPPAPSALAVLQTASQQLVLVTSEGADEVFAFTFNTFGTPAPPAGPPIMLPDLDVPSSPVAEPTAPSDAPLALVLTLEADNLPNSEPASAGADTIQVSTSEAAGAVGAAANAAILSGGDEPAQVADASEQILRGLDVDDVLRQLDLYEQTPDPDFDGPSSPRRMPEASVPSDQVPDPLWEAPSDALSAPSKGVLLLGDEFASLPAPRTASDASGCD